MVAWAVVKEHRWAWCSTCHKAMVKCGTCGNNTCNAGFGTLPDGTTCGDCEGAYTKSHAQPTPRHPNEAELLEHHAKVGTAPQEIERLVAAAGDQYPLDYFLEVRDRCIDPEEARLSLSDLCRNGPACEACFELQRVMYPDHFKAAHPLTDAALQYHQLRTQRATTRQRSYPHHRLTHQEEADWGAQMDVFWQQMTKEERREVDPDAD